jgi:tctex1 domain-containing protein 2
MEIPAAIFEIKPELGNIIPPAEVKKLIQQTLHETLQNKSYSTENAKKWTKSIADDINRTLNAFNKRYKHVVQVVVTEKKGQGIKCSAQCRWDCESDRQISENFINDTIICIVTVFGIYMY